MALPLGSVNSQVVTSAANVLIPSGAVINLNAIMWIERQGIIVKIKMRDGTNFDQPFPTTTAADAFLSQLVQAASPATIGAPFIGSITPNSAPNSTTVNAVIRGQGFKTTGTVMVNVGVDTVVLTFIDSFTLLVVITGNSPPGFVDVTYTDPDLTTTATLVGGFEWV